MRARGRLVVASIATAMLVTAPTKADDRKERCIEQNKQAQSLRRDHKLEASRMQLRACAATTCPALVREDCAARLDELERAQPTIVVNVVDAAGHAITAATLEVDERQVADRLDGAAIALDPGEHSLVLRPSGGAAPVTRTVVLREGEKARHERIVLGEPAPEKRTTGAPATASDGGVPWSTIGLVAAGVGVVSLGVGTYFAFDAKSKNDASNASGCSGDNCTPSAAATRRDALSSAGVSTLTIAIGAALAVGGVSLWYFAPRRDVAVTVAPTAAASGGGIAAVGVF